MRPSENRKITELELEPVFAAGPNAFTADYTDFTDILVLPFQSQWHPFTILENARWLRWFGICDYLSYLRLKQIGIEPQNTQTTRKPERNPLLLFFRVFRVFCGYRIGGLEYTRKFVGKNGPCSQLIAAEPRSTEEIFEPRIPRITRIFLPLFIRVIRVIRGASGLLIEPSTTAEPRWDYLSYLRLKQIGIEPQMAQMTQIGTESIRTEKFRSALKPRPDPKHFTGGSGGRGEDELGGSETIHSLRIGETQRHGDTKGEHGQRDQNPSFVPSGESSGLAAGALGLCVIQSFLHQRFADQDCIRSVDLKDTYSGPAQRRQPDEPCIHEGTSGGRTRPLLRRPGFGLEKLQCAANSHVIVQFPFLRGGQTACPRFGCKFIGPIQVAQRELQAQERSGFGGRKTPNLRLDRPLPDSDRGVIGKNRIHRPSPCPVLGAFQARIPPHFTGGNGGRGENESEFSETIYSPRIGEPQFEPRIGGMSLSLKHDASAIDHQPFPISHHPFSPNR